MFEMAQALDKNGDKDQAKAQYQRLIDKYPDTDAAKAAKARLP